MHHQCKKIREASAASNIWTSKENEHFLARKSLQHFLGWVPSSSEAREAPLHVRASFLLAEDPTAATRAAPAGQGSRDDTRGCQRQTVRKLGGALRTLHSPKPALK